MPFHTSFAVIAISLFCFLDHGDSVMCRCHSCCYLKLVLIVRGFFFNALTDREWNGISHPTSQTSRNKHYVARSRQEEGEKFRIRNKPTLDYRPFLYTACSCSMSAHRAIFNTIWSESWKSLENLTFWYRILDFLTNRPQTAQIGCHKSSTPT